MAKPICAVSLPPELQRELPAGVLVYSFDGEVVFRSKNPNLNQEPRTFSLLPIQDNESMYERRWPGNPVQETYLSIEHFHGHAVRMFYFYLPIPKSTASELSGKLLPMVREAAKNLQIKEELYSAAEKFLPGKETESGPLYRAEAFAAMSWSSHQWIWITSTIATGFVMGGPQAIPKVLLKSMFTWNFVGKTQDQNDRYANLIDRLVTHFRQQMNLELQQNESAGGRL